MTTPPIINLSVVKQIVSMLDSIYRSGVNDARRYADEGGAMEFVEEVSKVGVYGFLGGDCVKMRVLEWQLRLIERARMTAMYGIMYNFLNRTGRFGSNYLSVFYVVAKEYYLRGIKDYYATCGCVDIDKFNLRTRKRLTRNGLCNVNTPQFVQDIQLICFELMRKHAEYREEHEGDIKECRKTLSEKRFDWFIRAMSLGLIRKPETWQR